MKITNILTTVAAVAVLSTPTIAYSANSGSQQKAEVAKVERASAKSDKKSNLESKDFVVAGLAAAIVIGGVILVSDNDEDNFPLPTSP